MYEPLKFKRIDEKYINEHYTKLCIPGIKDSLIINVYKKKL